jgi:hypothetical protein
VRRGDDLAVADQEDVLARALADEAALVEQDRLLVAGVGRLGLGEDRVEVLPGGLGVRDQPAGADPAPARDLGADAVLLALLAEVGAPGEGGDDQVDRGVGGVEAEVAVAAEGERPDVAGAEPVAADQLTRRLGDLLGRVGKAAGPRSVS